MNIHPEIHRRGENCKIFTEIVPIFPSTYEKINLSGENNKQKHSYIVYFANSKRLLKRILKHSLKVSLENFQENLLRRKNKRLQKRIQTITYVFMRHLNCKILCLRG